MKTMTCEQLGGACDETFSAETFEEMATLAKEHGMSMKNDPAHQEAMMKMMQLMSHPEEMEKWVDSKRQAFDETAED